MNRILNIPENYYSPPINIFLQIDNSIQNMVIYEHFGGGGEANFGIAWISEEVPLTG